MELEVNLCDCEVKKEKCVYIGFIWAGLWLLNANRKFDWRVG